MHSPTGVKYLPTGLIHVTPYGSAKIKYSNYKPKGTSND
jgi:hypothetical protein